MLNNRQQGRRRGRGRNPQGGGNRNENSSRIDNRARGNAPQMLEKYKNMARDAQLQGDRVMTEYYLQFADHYFRIVAEQRARFEEQRRDRDGWSEEGDEGGSYERQGQSDGGDYADADDGESEVSEPRRQEQRPRNERGNDRDRNYNRQSRDDNSRRDRSGFANGNSARDEDTAPTTLDISVLPPAFASDGPMVPIDLDEEPVAAPAPRRRGRPRRDAEEVGEAAE